MSRRKGFTLIELLAVMAIIALLVSIMAPALRYGVDFVRATICAGQIRQLAVAWCNYANENDSRVVPSHISTHYVDGQGKVWQAYLRPYYQDVKGIFMCPEAEVPWSGPPINGYGIPQGTASHAWGPAYGGSYQGGETDDFGSYGYNNWGSWDNPWGGAPQYGLGGYSAAPGQVMSDDYYELPASRVNVPADMIAIGDSSVNGYWDAFIDPEPEKDPAVEWPEYPSGRHMGKTNLVFCDGHAESIPRDDIVGNSYRAIRRWNNDNKHHIRP